MYKATAKAEQFQARIANESTKGSRKGFAEGGENPLAVLDPEDRRNSLVAVLKGLDIEKQAAKKAGNAARVKNIGLRMFEVTEEIRAMRKARRSENATEIPMLFMDICRESMTKPQFSAIMLEANRRQRVALGLEQPKKISNGQA